MLDFLVFLHKTDRYWVGNKCGTLKSKFEFSKRNLRQLLVLSNKVLDFLAKKLIMFNVQLFMEFKHNRNQCLIQIIDEFRYLYMSVKFSKDKSWCHH